jgi:hypothetical protein
VLAIEFGATGSGDLTKRRQRRRKKRGKERIWFEGEIK